MISGELLIALKEALASIYWTKSDLKCYIRNTITHQEVIGYVDWEQTKYESCSQLIDYMASKQEMFREDIYTLINSIVQMTDFSHLRRWENGEKLVNKAIASVGRLNKISNNYLADFSDIIEIKNNRKRNQEQQIKTLDYHNKISAFNDEFSKIVKEPAQQRGYLLEQFLADLFSFFDLAPRSAFKIKGEQIDGSFTHEGTDYLLEAKWQNKTIPNADLYTFAGKIDGKLKNTLGVFISMSGFSQESLDSNSHINKSMILLDGIDLMMVLEDRISLPDMIRLKRRHASETGEIMYRIQLS